ncbi:MAG: SpoIIE family protein phosphatase [Chlamydiae bacterium]|nr:SpoIIE family protein phosphatase [Chlamydiota bacterium]MBI3276456.1 SpoIIE family protein phosphatase [Chlamydiota bacterium]
MNLIVIHGVEEGQVYPIHEGVSIGRDKSNQWVLHDLRVSEFHAQISKDEGSYILRNLDAVNGTYVNGIFINRYVLKEGDEILLGGTLLKFSSALALSHEERENPLEVVTKKLISPPIAQIFPSQDLSSYLEFEPSFSDLELIKKTEKNLSLFYRASSILNSILEEDFLIYKILDLIGEVISADRYVILCCDEKTQEFVPRSIRRGTDRAGYYPLEISKEILDTVLREGVGVLCVHAGQDERFRKSQTVQIHGIKSAICVPIILKKNVLGMIYCDTLFKMGQFEEDDLRFLSGFAAQVAVSLSQVRQYQKIYGEGQNVKYESEAIDQIHQALLPKEFPEIPGFDFSFCRWAAKEVGNDYYDWYWVDDYRLALVLADVSGKGISGALAMAMFRLMLKTKIKGALSPKELLNTLNQWLLKNLKKDMLISCNIVFLDVKNDVLSFARAGHLPLLIMRDEGKEKIQLTTKGVALGVSDWDSENMIEEKNIELKKGDKIFFYTDGALHARNAFHQTFEHYFIPAIENVLKEASHEKAKVILQKLLKQVTEFIQDQPQTDDVTLGLVKVG